MRARQRHLNPGHFGAAIALDARFGFSQADGTAVSTWEDRTNNNNDASQATAANQPTYTSNGLNGNPVVTFPGTASPNQDYLDVASITVNQPITIVSVFRANGANNYLFDATSNTSRVIIGYNLVSSTSGRLAVLSGGASSLVDTVTSNGSVQIVSSVIDTSSSGLWRNGVSRASGTLGSNNIASIRLGERHANVGNATQLNGYIATYTALSVSSDPIRKRIEHSYGYAYKLPCS
jgi:hypothetical protein